MSFKSKIKGFATTTGKYIKKGGKAIAKGAKKAAVGTKNVVTSPGFKKGIKGVAKTIGKYSLKGVGKGFELLTRATSKTVSAIVKNPIAQKIVTTAGIIAASVYVPVIPVIIIGGIGMKILIDKALLSKNKSITGEITDTIKYVIEKGNVVTKAACNKIVGPAFDKINTGSKSLGTKYQSKIDNIFR